MSSKYRDNDCRKFKKFQECGNYDDFKSEYSGIYEDKIKYIIEKLSKVKKSENLNEKKLEKCPYNLNCIFIFKKPCDYSRLHHECCDFECEDCGLNIPDLGIYCETNEYEKCESYEIISVIKEGYESIGICCTEDLKEHFGEENYEWLGGYIRCAFMEPEDMV